MGGGSVLPQFFFICPQQEVSHFVENEERGQNAQVTQVSEDSTSSVTAYILDQTRTRRELAWCDKRGGDPYGVGFSDWQGEVQNSLAIK